MATSEANFREALTLGNSDSRKICVPETEPRWLLREEICGSSCASICEDAAPEPTDPDTLDDEEGPGALFCRGGKRERRSKGHQVVLEQYYCRPRLRSDKEQITIWQ